MTYMEIPLRRCPLNGCGRRHYARGYCQKHYRRYLRGGDVVNPQWMRTRYRLTNRGRLALGLPARYLELVLTND